MATEVIVPGVGTAELITRTPARRRRGKSPALAAARNQLEKAKAAKSRALKSARDLKAKLGTKGIVVVVVALVLGLILSGVLDAMGVDEIMGFDARYVIGAVLIGWAALGKHSSPMRALGIGTIGAAILAPAVADGVDDVVSGFLTAPPPEVV